MVEETPDYPSLGTSLKAYLGLRPDRPADAWRLLQAYVRALAHRLSHGRSAITVGDLLSEPTTVRHGASRFMVRPRCDDLGAATHAFKPSMGAWFHPRRGDVVIDVGAHIGAFAVPAAIAGARVFAVEPHPATYRVLEHNLELNRLSAAVRAVNVACGAASGEATLLTDRHTQSSSLLPGWRDRFGLPTGQSLAVRVETLDTLVEDWGLASVDWLLVDAEGFEVEVLRGASQTLRRTREVIVEVAHGPNYREARRILTAAGLPVVEEGTFTSVNRYLHAVRPPTRAAGTEANSP